MALGCGVSAPDDGDDDGSAVTDVSPAAALPHFQAFFAVPKADGTGDSALEDKVISLMNDAVAGSKIRIGMYQWSHTAPAEALVAASKRGVDVHVVIDEEANETTPSAAVEDIDDLDDDTTASPAAKLAFDSAIDVLRAGLPSGSITYCTRDNGSCQGNGINHNKIYMFSKLSDGSEDVVVQSSANLTTFHLHNNLVISRGDKALYDGYVTYFDALEAKKENLDYYRHFDGDHTIAYMFPRAEGDTITSILDNVHCTKSSIVRITMAFWDDYRIGIVGGLKDLVKAGCDVRVNMRKAGTNVSATVISELKAAGVKVGEYPSEHGTNIHSKYLLIDSDYDTSNGRAHRQLVWTGSHNYTKGALRDNDEVLLRVDNATIFADFLANWNTIHDQIGAK
ncbi:MAG TPA: phospholipase D-like domain-containing protein [Kofleriaceae bacterium]|jgi:phosphatidylserine/phosphatidylglycerophosphate/cardiolipin synthase-like enzyme